MASARKSYVVSTYSSLTTYAMYDTRNCLPLNVACRQRTHTLRNRVTCVLSALATLYPSVKKRSERGLQKHIRTKRLTAGCDCSLSDKYNVARVVFVSINSNIEQIHGILKQMVIICNATSKCSFTLNI